MLSPVVVKMSSKVTTCAYTRDKKNQEPIKVIILNEWIKVIFSKEGKESVIHIIFKCYPIFYR